MRGNQTLSFGNQIKGLAANSYVYGL